MSTLLDDERNLASLDDQFKETVTYHGREYQAYSINNEVYLAPIDDNEKEEEERLTAQHEILKEIYHEWETPFNATLVGEPKAVLDCGFGTAEWAVELAEWDPSCRVIGVDISPCMLPSDQPDNLELQISNLNDRFTFADESFDFVHSRFVAGGVGASRWPNYFRDINRILRPKGWVQVTEWDLEFRSDNGQTDKIQALREWTRIYFQSLGLARQAHGKKSTTLLQNCEIWLRMAGFSVQVTDVREIPTCGWHSDPVLRRIGQQNLDNIRMLIRAIAMYPITFRGIQNFEEFEQLITAASLELGAIEAKPYLRLSIALYKSLLSIYMLTEKQIHMLWHKSLMQSIALKIDTDNVAYSSKVFGGD